MSDFAKTLNADGFAQSLKAPNWNEAPSYGHFPWTYCVPDEVRGVWQDLPLTARAAVRMTAEAYASSLGASWEHQQGDDL